ncbi:hypothetical protein RirG_010510 [Rhizophagus irregularis DAOM 197198w]|uniref:Uncharacterized protein n=1 Tax=Rhizophagus irregularis (strain DAOM 197198w) TaxID=1432141 RepID=A0A015LGX1_RHIIW|nr:hypothetical protein RirG_010510 [Rhizophagus irregularis DAOM 197198w]
MSAGSFSRRTSKQRRKWSAVTIRYSREGFFLLAPPQLLAAGWSEKEKERERERGGERANRLTMKRGKLVVWFCCAFLLRAAAVPILAHKRALRGFGPHDQPPIADVRLHRHCLQLVNKTGKMSE